MHAARKKTNIAPRPSPFFPSSTTLLSNKRLRSSLPMSTSPIYTEKGGGRGNEIVRTTQLEFQLEYFIFGHAKMRERDFCLSLRAREYLNTPKKNLTKYVRRSSMDRKRNDRAETPSLFPLPPSPPPSSYAFSTSTTEREGWREKRREVVCETVDGRKERKRHTHTHTLGLSQGRREKRRSTQTWLSPLFSLSRCNLTEREKGGGGEEEGEKGALAPPPPCLLHGVSGVGVGVASVGSVGVGRLGSQTPSLPPHLSEKPSSLRPDLISVYSNSKWQRAKARSPSSWSLQCHSPGLEAESGPGNLAKMLLRDVILGWRRGMESAAAAAGTPSSSSSSSSCPKPISSALTAATATAAEEEKEAKGHKREKEEGSNNKRDGNNARKKIFSQFFFPSVARG